MVSPSWQNGRKPRHAIGKSNANSWRIGSDFLHESESESYLTQFSEKPHLELLEGSRFFCDPVGMLGRFFHQKKTETRETEMVSDCHATICC